MQESNSHKSLLNYVTLPRGKLRNFVRNARTSNSLDGSTGRFKGILKYLPSVWVAWIIPYLKSAFHSRCDFPAANGPSYNIFQLGSAGNDLTVALAGDWG